MHVIVAVDGSKQSLLAAKHFKSFADPQKIDNVSVIAVTSPYASVSFADDISPNASSKADQTFGEAAEAAVATVAAEFAGWGPKVQTRVRSGSPANEIVKAAKSLSADLVVVGSGSRGTQRHRPARERRPSGCSTPRPARCSSYVRRRGVAQVQGPPPQFLKPGRQTSKGRQQAADTLEA